MPKLEKEMAKIIKDLGKNKKKSEPQKNIIKVGKGSVGKSSKSEVNLVEDYNEADEGMDMEEETIVKEEGTSKV